jgi:hypothetical protein
VGLGVHDGTFELGSHRDVRVLDWLGIALATGGLKHGVCDDGRKDGLSLVEAGHSWRTD